MLKASNNSSYFNRFLRLGLDADASLVGLGNKDFRFGVEADAASPTPDCVVDNRPLSAMSGCACALDIEATTGAATGAGRMRGNWAEPPEPETTNQNQGLHPGQKKHGSAGSLWVSMCFSRGS